MKYTSRQSLTRILIFIIASGIVFYLLPRNNRQNYIYEENRPWTHALLTAPFDIPVYRDSASVNMLIDSINASFIPVYKRDNTIAASINERINALHSISASQKAEAINVIDHLYNIGIISPETSEMVSDGILSEVRIIEDAVAVEIPATTFKSQRNAYAYIDSVIHDPDIRHALQDIKLSTLLSPNIVNDTAETSRLYNEKTLPVKAAIGVIQQGERIIDRGDIVTPKLNQILMTYETMVNNRDTATTTKDINTSIGQILFTFILFGLQYIFLFLYRRESFDNLRQLLAIILLLVSFYVLAAVLSASFSIGLYLVPFSILAILMVVFFDRKTAMFTYLIEILLCTFFSSFQLEYIFIEIVVGVVTIFSLQELSRRSQLLRTAIIVFLCYVLSYVAIELMTTAGLSALSGRLIGYFAINMVLITFAYILIFIFEKLFGLISSVTLVELSDINNPLLRELSEECPGTFQHSMAVSNLASNAATRIGANVQLVRAGALYHDIGKINNPAFFTENQHGVNPHDALSPVQSARILLNHIHDGVKRADKAKLPKVLRDLILQHHGKGKAKYFYTIYCRQHPDEEVDESLFTYPGPNPQTKEASLLMMADTVEAASRSLTDHSPAAIAEMVNRLIDAQVNDGLHRESPLSFRDIQTIKESFITRLRTMYHSRVSYPAPEKTHRPSTDTSSTDSGNDTVKK